MRFKTKEIEQQWPMLYPALRAIGADLDREAIKRFGRDICVTRCWEAVSTESGVHLCRRAFDARIEIIDIAGEVIYRDFTIDQADELAEYLNKKYPRDDKYNVALVHKMPGSAMHFHIQIPHAWVFKQAG